MENGLSKKTKNVLDLFCGAGGFSLGFRQAGFTIAAGVEIEPAAIATYNYNFGLQMPPIDIVNTQPEKLGLTERVDVMIGGVPCQPFSKVNHRRGGDSRVGMYLYFKKYLDYFQPDYFVLENVDNLEKSPIFPDLKSKLSENYTITYRVLNAADYGVPQLRNRLFIVGTRIGISQLFRFPQPTRYGSAVTVREAFEGLPLNPTDEVFKTSEVVLERFRAMPMGGNMLDLPIELRPPNSVFSNSYQRLHWDKPAWTITTKCTSLAHPDGHRRVTVRELARIQSYPDDFVFLGKLAKSRIMLGNSVPPLLSYAIAKQLWEII